MNFDAVNHAAAELAVGVFALPVVTLRILAL